MRLLENHELAQLRLREYLSIGQVARVIDSTPNQIRKWERMGLMPRPQKWVRRGTRFDRFYTWPEIETMKEFRRVYKIGAPTAEESKARDRIKEQLSGPD